ncbi:isocitrate lyase/PEP mutase family protein [Pseudomonadales bacterium]|jgi:2-methylisocitrate lyase-like PEP mutase family enzyme|nr:isocitrate lyase/PEP mutase family protein [Gammaproteobacteria bacterium]MBT7538306.1 isocitrate lyase/PEP mutase family protein [Gammaproteobacteria bacterium]MDA7726342.1 isocitrate lyase/PEP mutase family protein [Pseudomonadales bacterium]MDA7833334.1 isocitrate lyase/PEP mutase family protein [Pseudomonadales bacterium]MDC1017259.1 isocitrate lyase/PEP mutase family protein [Pseudomonadales bacterium]|tara:strand:+ start:3017 stop:3844 length:828 start_codon:yes stop_codon:yes gene_type:complete
MLKDSLLKGQQIIAPGVFDGLSARIAQQSGCNVLYMSGFCVSGTLLGTPDVGLVTATEMIERVQQIVNSAPGAAVIADGDNGHGGVHNVARIVRAYETAGAECIQLEDQVIPKKCGHMENKQVVALEDAAQKIEAACAARRSNDFLIMARTDARATHNLDEALKRGDAFLEAGADILFIEAPASVEEMTLIAKRFPNTPLVANLVEGGKTPELSPAELKSMGFLIVLRPVSALLSISATLQQNYKSLANSGTLGENAPHLSFDEYNKMIGLQDYN